VAGAVVPGDAAGAADEIAGGTAVRPLSVGQVNGFLNQTLSLVLPPTFFVQGEISNFRTYDRGHAFFTLKDAAAELPCILWKDGLARLKFRPKDGLAVIARGAVRLYEPQGKLQLYVETLFPQGAGALELAFRQLCEKLRAEGLFEAGRKRKIPRLPRHVVIVTSKTGDVLHDVLTTALRRWAGVRMSLVAVRVQGAQAAGEIVRAIEGVNRYCASFSARGMEDFPPDLILLVRGGGSLEDLWAFNEEAVARAIVASRIPIATGIGHEPDTTIADLVGDLRGPTPTGVTELTIPDARALLAEINGRAALLTRDVRRMVTLRQSELERETQRLATVGLEALRNRELRIDLLCRQIERIEPRHAIAQGWRRVEEAQRRLEKGVRDKLRRNLDAVGLSANRLERCSPLGRVVRQRDGLVHAKARLLAGMRARLALAGQKLEAVGAELRVVSPQAVLERGFSITTDQEGKIVRKVGDVKRGDVMVTRVADGKIESVVGKPKQGSLF